MEKNLFYARLVVGLLGFAVITSLWLVNVVPFAFVALLDLVFIVSVAKIHIADALVVSAVAAVFLILGTFFPVFEIWPPMLIYRGGAGMINTLIFVNVVVNTIIYAVGTMIVLLVGGFLYIKFKK